EILDALADPAHDVGQPVGTEDQHHDAEDDDKFRQAYPTHIALLAPARRPASLRKSRFIVPLTAGRGRPVSTRAWPADAVGDPCRAVCRPPDTGKSRGGPRSRAMRSRTSGRSRAKRTARSGEPRGRARDR